MNSSLTRVKVDVEPTVVYRDYRSNQSLAGMIEGVIEGIAIHWTSLDV